VPVAVAEAVDRSGYGRFPEHLERDWLGRLCHLSEADVSLVCRRDEDTTRLGFGAQLVKHSAEIRDRYGYTDFTSEPGHVPLVRITGLVQALERLGEVRALGVGDLDLSRLPPRRVAGLARYAEDAWATQLADLAPKRRVASLIAYVHDLGTSARDDVIDIFDVVFGDLQRAATNRGKTRRADELREYDLAVGELQNTMQSVLDALDDDTAIAVVLEALHIDPADVARLSPLGHPIINLQGRYRTTGRASTGGLRPLRTAEQHG